MTRSPAPATLALLTAGIQPKTLATDLDVTPQAISYQLAGKTATTSTELLAAIAQRGGHDLADTIAELIALSREERQTA